MSACVLPPERQGLVERVDDGGVADGAAVDIELGPRDAAAAGDFETLTDGAQSPDGAQGADAAQSPDGAQVADAAQTPDGAQGADAAQAPECSSDEGCAAAEYCDSRGHCASGCRVEPDNCPTDQVCDPVVRTCANPACSRDTDSDGTPDCNDACPADAGKTGPGLCGCGLADTDSDGDGTPNCGDNCPDDPEKQVVGVCGCGVPDLDTDGDNAFDCVDLCPNDAEKGQPGRCGCGVPDTDADADGTSDCSDLCPNDANKAAAGVCGCGVADTDSDNDGTPNCNDLCPNDASKVAPGVCGCAVADTDSDNDGTANCNDQCPNDANKVAPRVCGCAVADTDSDNDGTPNCTDACPNDPARSALNACGACAALPAEVCDQQDNNCDGNVDEGLANCCAPGQTVSCGSDVGACAEGLQTCEANRAYGACVGAVGPSIEVCDGVDNDCDGATDNAGANLCAAGLSCVRGACVAAPAIPPGYVRIAPGVFTMGSPAGELGRRAEEVQHQVTITRAFLMKTTEVTQAEWQAVMGNNPSQFAACGGSCPVEQVSWNDAVDYVNRLSDAAGLARCYDANRAFAGLECLGYRLPTEAEWEYAARAGTQTAYNTGVNTQTGCVNDPNLDLAGWYCGNANNTTHPVGQKRANEWGLLDMHGNVWEWVQDWYGGYQGGAVSDPIGPPIGDGQVGRIGRGGSWGIVAQLARAAQRGWNHPGHRNGYIGLRPVRSLL